MNQTPRAASLKAVAVILPTIVMRKVPRSTFSRLPAVMHKLFVLSCVGVTLATTAFTGGLLHYHYTVVLPQREKDEEAADAAKSAAARSKFDLEDGSSSGSVLEA